MTQEIIRPRLPGEARIPTLAEQAERADRIVERAFFERDAADRAIITAFLRDALDA